MWVNPLFDETHRASALDLVHANSLATVLVADPLRVSHVPVLLEEGPDGQLEMVGHIPRADPASDAIIAGGTVIVVFHGARSYVSPDWYVAPGLPTYNFLVAHLEGVAQVMDDPEELRAHLLDLTHTLEGRRHDLDVEWTPDEVARVRMDFLMPLIIGFRIPVTRMQVKAKLGQNRTVEDQENVAAVLHTSETTDDIIIANRMQESGEERSAK